MKELTNLFKKIIQKKMQNNEMRNGKETIVMVENTNGRYESTRAEVPSGGYKTKTIKLVLDYRTGTEPMGECSVLLGDSADLFKTKNPALQIITPALKVGGTYGSKTLGLLNRFALGTNTRLHEAQGSANVDEFWNNKEPMSYLEGMLGEDPRSVPVDFQMTVSASDLNLTVRLDKDFRFDTSVITALQLRVSPGELITWTFKLRSVGTGALMELV